MPNEVPRLIMAALAVIAAGFVRGYSGFGFALITTTSLLLLFTPTEAVPAVLLLDIGASTLLMRQVWRQVSWAAIGWLLLGVFAGTLPGVWLLSRVPAAPMKLAVALCILVLVGLLRRGRHPQKAPGRLAAVATGILSGLLNGVGAVGGPPAILFFFASPAGAAVSRASLIAFFLGTDLLAATVCLAAGLMSVRALGLAGWLLLPMAAGLLLGSRAFQRTSSKVFRQRVLALLAALALGVVAQALWHIATAPG
jgi:uncharacterized membrane protein YfcA